MQKNTQKNLAIIVVFIILGISAYFAYSYSNKKALELQTITKPTENTTPTESVDNGNIHVFKPKKGDSVGLPLKILGEVRVFENQFNVRIKDAKGNIVKEESMMAENGDMGQFNLFSKEMNYNKPTTSTGTIEFFDYSAKDGAEIDKVIIPVKFEPVYNALNIQVFFGNTQKNPNAEDCSEVYPVNRRIAYTKNTAEMAIKELLSGLSTTEVEKGYFTSVNSGVKLNKITIKNGTAFVDFDEMLQNQVGGSCRVSAISAQIRETLKQFPNISEVEISINGKTEEILQP